MYRETEWTLFEDSDSLIPLCKCNSHKKPVDGELIARKPGIYTLVFDNKSSRWADFNTSKIRLWLLFSYYLALKFLE